MKELIKEIKMLEGKLIVIGIDDDNLKEAIEKNNKLNDVIMLHNLDKEQDGNSKIKVKELNINKFKKHFKKNKHETLIYNFSHIEKYLHIFIKDSIYITKNTIYCVCDYDEEIALIKKRYKRYKVKITSTDEKIIKIDVQNAKNRFINDKLFFIKDIIYVATEFTSQLLLKWPKKVFFLL